MPTHETSRKEKGAKETRQSVEERATSSWEQTQTDKAAQEHEQGKEKGLGSGGTWTFVHRSVVFLL